MTFARFGDLTGVVRNTRSNDIVFQVIYFDNEIEIDFGMKVRSLC